MASLLLLKSLIYIKAMQKNKIKALSRGISCNKEKDLCCTCNEAEGTIPIINNVLQPNLKKEIQYFSGVVIEDSEKCLCQSCMELLNGCIKFRDMCRRNNEVLLNVNVESGIEQSTDDQLLTFDDDDKNVDESTYSPSSTNDFNYDENMWACTTCAEAFYELGSYKRHLPTCVPRTNKNQTVLDNKKHKTHLCDVCGKTLTTFASLNIHRNTHKNIFPFKCDMCSYRGRSMDLLKVHKRIHLDVKPYKCSLCPKTTTTASNLRRHVNVHNNETNKPHKCQLCDRAFFYKRDMTRHIKEIHLRQDAAECPICHKKFATHKIMRGHRLKVHKIKAERTGRVPSYLHYVNTQVEDNEERTTYQNL